MVASLGLCSLHTARRCRFCLRDHETITVQGGDGLFDPLINAKSAERQLPKPSRAKLDLWPLMLLLHIPRLQVFGTQNHQVGFTRLRIVQTWLRRTLHIWYDLTTDSGISDTCVSGSGISTSVSNSSNITRSQDASDAPGHWASKLQWCHEDLLGWNAHYYSSSAAQFIPSMMLILVLPVLAQQIKSLSILL